MAKKGVNVKSLSKSKKGDSHVDWIIAGSIFILFLSYFFILVKPVFFPAQKETVTTELLEQNLEKDLFWTLKKIPLLVHADKYFDAYALRAKTTFTSDSGMILSDNTSFFVDNGYLLTVKTLNRTSYFDVTYSNKTYDEGKTDLELAATSTNITTHNLDAIMQDSLIESVTYAGFLRINGMSIYAGSYLLVPESHGFTNGHVLGKYNSKFGNLNNTFYIYAGTPTIDQRIDSAYDTSVSMTLHGYYYYYVDATINGNNTGCFGRDSDAIIFYNEYDGLIVKFSENTPFMFCQNPDYTTSLNISIGQRNESWIRYEFFAGKLEEGMLHRNVSYFFGLPYDVVGISEEKLILLNNTDYGRIKEQWNYPAGKDFRITLVNSTTQIGGTPPEINIYAKNYNTYFLDKYGNKIPAKFALQVW